MPKELQSGSIPLPFGRKCLSCEGHLMFEDGGHILVGWEMHKRRQEMGDSCIPENMRLGATAVEMVDILDEHLSKH